ncbi:HD domain-containing protein [Actinomycetes bacterium KLBMP 9759]
MTVSDPRELCRSLLEAELPRRWAHSQGVARQAAGIGHTLNGAGALVESAAWLHDIGYASPLAHCGFHPLDGARYLRDNAIGDRHLWTLVAHHTGALIEAEGRGLGDQLAAEFPIDDVDPFLLAALTYCDMTTSPDGEIVDAKQRIDEILTRYPADHVVHRSISRAAPTLRAQVDKVIAHIGAA